MVMDFLLLAASNRTMLPLAASCGWLQQLLVMDFRRTMRRHLAATVGQQVLAWMVVRLLVIQMQVDTLSGHGALVRSRDNRYLERALVCHHSPFRKCNRCMVTTADPCARSDLQTLVLHPKCRLMQLGFMCGLMSVG